MTSRRRYRVPANDGEALIDPPLSEAAKLIEYNREVSRQFDQACGPPPELRATARFLATLGMDSLRDERGGFQIGPLILTGHQPELYHPGVWLKTFIVSSIAHSVGGLSLNLVVDSDTIRGATIRVPTEHLSTPSIVDVPFDASADEMPWACRGLLDPELFSTFASRVASQFGTYQSAAAYRGGMLLDQFWPAAVESKERMLVHSAELAAKVGCSVPPEIIAAKQNLGTALSFARRDLEQRIGLRIHDETLGLACINSGYIWFVNHLFARHRELFETYNAALGEYRAINGIRDDLRPVPNLTRRGDWYEVPFWLWNEPHDVRRRRAFVRQSGSSWELSDLGDLNFRPPAGTEHDLDALLLALIKDGPTLRPRALITTMYARLILSDLFIHGIGGAKYDEVTDEIIRRFFGIEPPKYITATATFRLPIERPHVTIEDVRDVRQKLRDVRYRPENLLRDRLMRQVPGLREQLQSFADEKREYVRTHDLRRCEEQVFARLDTINRAMHELLKPVEQELHAQHAQVQEDLRRADLLGSREFSFVLFPADELPARAY